MFARNPNNETGKELPSEWTLKCKETLNQVYETNCSKENKNFDVYGYVYKNELLLIVSLLDEKTISKIPISIFLSSDISEKSDNKKILNIMVDLAGTFFDSYFNLKDENLYNTIWQEKTIKNEIIFIKVTRENVALTIEANKILGNASE